MCALTPCNCRRRRTRDTPRGSSGIFSLRIPISFIYFTNERLQDDFPELLERYGPGSSPGSKVEYDSTDLLVDRLRQTNVVRVTRIAAMTADELAAPMPDHLLASVQPTIGHHVQSLVFHEGYHAGQLSSWRKAHGFAAVRWTMGPR